MRIIIILSFLLFGYLGNTQLIDPFGKVVTHEIKLTKLDDGAYMGAMEWTTGGIDSLQRFVVKGLSVKAPVMVRIISKAPNHNIDLSFHKEKWDNVESQISTDGEKFVDKIFRTMGIAGIGVSSKVAGIPYLIIVKVGLQFPSTKSLIRVTDDIEEYNRHLSNLGIATIADTDKNGTSFKNEGIAETNSEKNDNTLTYIIIGLLSLIIVLLGVFLIRKQKSKTTLVLWFTLCLSAYTMAQSNAPKSVPIGNPNGDAVFVEYRTSNVANQVPVETVMNIGAADMVVAGDTSLETVLLRMDTAPGVRELTGEEAAEVLRRIKEANEEFDRDYRENMPGEPTDGDQRVPPSDQTGEELEQLRRQVRQLQQEVALLSERDREFDGENQNNEAQIVILCDDIIACTRCLQQWRSKLQVRDAYFQYLQSFYAHEIKDINNKIAWGNAGSNVHGVSAIVWQRILHDNIMPAVRTLKVAYNTKFDEYIESMRRVVASMETCHTTQNPDGRQSRAIKEQAKALVEYYSRTKIID